MCVCASACANVCMYVLVHGLSVWGKLWVWVGGCVHACMYGGMPGLYMCVSVGG